MRKILLLLLAGAMLLGIGAAPLVAADASAKPIAVVSLASYDELVLDISFVGKLAERPELGSALDGLLAVVTGGKGLVGIDKTRPWGVVLTGEDSKVAGYGFLPITDLKEALSLLEMHADFEETGGITKISPKDGKKPFYVKAVDKWAFAAEKPEMLARVVANPLRLLAGVEKQYLVTGRLFAANIPAKLRDKFVADMKRNAQKDLEKKPGESDKGFEARKKIAADVLAMVTGAVNDLDQITLGWALDRKAEKTFLDVSVTARKGTPTAAQMALVEMAKSQFSGFHVPGAALTGQWVGKIPAAKIDLINTIIDGARSEVVAKIDAEGQSDEHKQAAKQVVQSLAELAQKTTQSGRFDSAFSAVVGPNAATLSYGGFVADGSLLEKAVRTLADMAKKEHPEVTDWIKLDAGSVNDVKFHAASIPIPSETNDRDKIVQLIGEKLDVVIGVGPKSFYFAIGRDAMASLKRAIEASAAQVSKAVPPVEFSLAAEPMANFIAKYGKDHERKGAELLGAQLKKDSGKDHIRLMAKPIARGVQYRLEVEPGLLHAIGHAAAAAQNRSAM